MLANKPFGYLHQQPSQTSFYLEAPLCTRLTQPIRRSPTWLPIYTAVNSTIISLVRLSLLFVVKSVEYKLYITKQAFVKKYQLQVTYVAERAMAL